MVIKFGTDGWRAVIAEDFTFENLGIVTQAIANYILSSNDPGEGVVVGYDMRFMSEEFAEKVAEVLAGNNIKVYMISKPTPTPVTAYAIKEWKATGAIMLTASHNPHTYHGIKYIPYFAGPALPETTDIIEANLKRLQKKDIRKMPLEDVLKKGLLEKIDPKRAYLEHLKKIIDYESIKKEPLKIVIDPMHGAGVGYLESFLAETSCEIKVIHTTRDPLFGGRMPEPKADQLISLKELVLSENADLGLALDGDADRFGIIDKNGNYISPNQVLALVLEHLITQKGLKGPVVRTVATTHILDKINETLGQKVIETSVGFKYIGQALRDEGCILGGEESGGLSIKGHIPEKDGILACLLVLEILIKNKKSLTKILEDLQEKYGPFYSGRLDIEVKKEEKEPLLEVVKNYRPEKLLGKEVVERIDIDGTKLILSDGSWVLIRPSGTEPLFRIYAEAETYEKVDSLHETIKKEIFS